MSDSAAFAKRYSDILKSGFVESEVLQRHVEEYGEIDKILPKSAAFFYIIDLATSTYRFLGKQQQSISGVFNDDLFQSGIGGFLQRIHPDEVGVVVNEVYKDFIIWFEEIKEVLDPADIVYQYNYRFLDGNGMYINLMEHVHILETDVSGRAALLLGNVITVDSDQPLPVRSSMKVYRGEGVLETLYSKTYSNYFTTHNITRREQDILRNLALGKTSKQIADKLFISHNTVDTHRRNLLKKLNCTSVVELAQIAFRNGIL